jgi:nucleotide-binding universal stress UspA family protein
MKILLGIDTSPLASKTIATVQRMFGSTGASIHVLSVVGTNEAQTTPQPVMLASVAQNIAVLDAEYVHTHEEVVTRVVARLRAAGLSVTSEIEFGDPRHVLVHVARSHGADLIVIGSHGHSAIHRLVMGSVASYVVNHAPCDVLVVRHTHDDASDRSS